MFAVLAILGLFVCFTQAAVPANNQPTFHVIKHDRIYYFVEPKFEANFVGALEFCERNGMELASIESPAQNQALYNGLMRLVGSTVSRFWVSGSRLSTNGAGPFVWMTTGNRIGNGYFGNNEPSTNGAGARQQCIQLFLNKYQNGYWDDVECDSVRSVVCQSVDY